MGTVSDKAIFESIIWPKYKEPVKLLCDSCWEVAKSTNKNISNIKEVPSWFLDIIQMHIKNALGICFSTPNQWIVIPEFIETFTLVIYKKQIATNISSSANVVSSLARLQDVSEISFIVEKTVMQIIKGYMLVNGSVIEIENEDAFFYIFPKLKSPIFLKQLGFDEKQISFIENESNLKKS